MMKTILALALTLSIAASCTDLPSASTAHRHKELDGLFTKLQTASTAEEAEKIEVAILHVLARSGEKEVDDMTVKGLNALNDGNLKQALRFFDQVVVRAPHFVEGWNLRATVYWLQDDYPRAIGDLRHALALEPRHFGAMTLLGRIFVEMEQHEAARAMLERALEINPHHEFARRQLNEISNQVAGIPI